MPAEEIDLFCSSLACYISVRRPATAAESLNPQRQHRSGALCPHGRHNLLSGRLTEEPQQHGNEVRQPAFPRLLLICKSFHRGHRGEMKERRPPRVSSGAFPVSSFRWHTLGDAIIPKVKRSDDAWMNLTSRWRAAPAAGHVRECTPRLLLGGVGKTERLRWIPGLPSQIRAPFVSPPRSRKCVRHLFAKIALSSPLTVSPFSF